MKVFVTGATGLLGNNVVRALRARGDEVVGLVRSREKGERMLGDTGARLVVGDVRESAAFAAELGSCDAVVHTAAYFREYYQPGDHAQLLEDVNVRATLELLALADGAGVSRFVHTSSSGTVGPKADGSAGDEDSAPPPIARENLYFKSKVDGDAKIRAFVPRSGMKVIEILPGWMWGPGDAGPTSAGQVALDFLRRKLPGIPPGGASVVDARDVADAMLAALDRAEHGARYLVAGRAMTLAEVFAELERASGVRAPAMRIPYWLAMTVATWNEAVTSITGKPSTVTKSGVRALSAPRVLSSARAERELGARFRPFAETARDVVAWYREHPLAT